MFNFSLRIGRKDYLIRIFSSTLIICLVAGLLDYLPDNNIVTTILAIIYLVLVGVYVIYALCLIRQRANDIGWHPLILTLLTLIISIGVIIIGFLPGQRTANRYGQPAA